MADTIANIFLIICIISVVPIYFIGRYYAKKRDAGDSEKEDAQKHYTPTKFTHPIGIAIIVLGLVIDLIVGTKINLAVVGGLWMIGGGYLYDKLTPKK